MPAHTNALAGETSPYLLQHAHNPVDWNPWGEAALEQAKAEDKLLIVSIGYAACHWCHVMERESFEDSTVAAVMNEHYVSVKVDREERPDVDDVYMTACHLTSGGSCGWPLNAIALPDGRPIWAGTYFPRERWIEILNYFSQLRKDEPEKLATYAQQVQQQLSNSSAQPPMPQVQGFDNTVADRSAKRLVELMDTRFGGLGGAPKFPMPVVYEFLLHHALAAGDTSSMESIERTLLAMARGGIYDQLGGGFARYSVDERWHAPHFEKMLYDNGQLVSLYAHAFRQNPLAEYEDVVRQTLGFVERELTTPDGGFFSSLDADSEGEEGKFYVWDYKELQRLLTEEELSALDAAYGTHPDGNWEKDKNILHRQGSWSEIVERSSKQETDLRQVLAKAEEKLRTERSTRIRPGLDDKVLVSWNALMLKGYVDAYLAFGELNYLEVAQRNAAYLESTFLQKDGRLLRTSAKGKTHINAFLDDYANLADAYLALYQAGFDEHWLERARTLADYALEHFADSSAALLYYTSDLDPALVARRVEDADNVIPSSNSVFADVLITLGTIYSDEGYLQRGEAMVATVLPSLAEGAQPAYWSRWLQLHTFLSHTHYEVALAGVAALEKRTNLARRYTPQAVFVGSEKESSLELLDSKHQVGTTLIYVCENRVCQLPTDDADVALRQLFSGR